MSLDLVDQLEPRQGWGEESGKWCGRPDLNRHGLTPNGFSYHYGFRRRSPDESVCGLDYPFTIAFAPTWRSH